MTQHIFTISRYVRSTRNASCALPFNSQFAQCAHFCVNKTAAINESDDKKKEISTPKERKSTFIKQQLRVRNKQRIAPIPYSCLVVFHFDKCLE